jgi:hypothetical protein
MDSWTRNAVVIAATLTILWNVPLAATESETSDVRIRILDYARIANDVLAQAQQRVTDIYIGIGVQIRWQVTALPLDPSSSGADTVTEPSEFVLIVLSPNMSRRLKIARDAVGMRSSRRKVVAALPMFCSTASRWQPGPHDRM